MYYEHQYTSSSYQYYKNAAETAKLLLYDDSATESDVRLAVNGLKQAISRLVALGDMTDLQILSIQVKDHYLTDGDGDLLTSQRYTKSTLDQLQSVYDRALVMLEENDSSKAEVDELYLALHDAISKLVDKISLYEAIRRMDTYLAMQSKYTDASFDSYLFTVTKAMLINEKYDANVEEIQNAVLSIEQAENALIRRPLTASGNTDFDLGSLGVDCHGCYTTLAAYLSNYSVFYNEVFDSFAMIGQINQFTFRLRNGYSISFAETSLSISANGRDKSDTSVSVAGIDFTMDEYSVGTLLGAPTEYISTGSVANLIYVDASSGIRVTFTFSSGELSKIEINKINNI